MSWLYGMENYVELRGSYFDNFKKDFALRDEVQSYLYLNLFRKKEEKNKNLVISGESGSGKSLFLLKLYGDLNNNCLLHDAIIIYYKFREQEGECEPSLHLKNITMLIQQSCYQRT